jgi:hypothetical protein
MTIDIDHEGTSEVVCPFCGYANGDSWELGDMGRAEDFDHMCNQCEETMRVSRCISVTYTTRKAAP